MRAAAIVLTLFTQTLAAQSETLPCDDPYSGKRLDSVTIEKVLEQHAELVAEWRRYKLIDGVFATDPRSAKLCEADLENSKLSGASLTHAGLIGANLARADLSSADLSRTTLSGANLVEANLFKANLAEANLSWANLSNANLVGADLSGSNSFEVNMSGANMLSVNLTKAKLWNVDLSGAYLDLATFTGANVADVNMSGAILIDAELSNVEFNSVVLSNADMTRAKLSGARLEGANLTNAVFRQTELLGSSFKEADVSGAIFEPLEGSLPTVDSMAQTRGLSTLTYEQPRALVKLRKLFKDAGYRDQERQITYALKHGEVLERLERSDQESLYNYGFALVDGGFNYLLFDFTTRWGMSPSRALWLVALFAVLFAPIYRKALSKPTSDGIWIVWNDDRRRQDLGTSVNGCGSNNSPFEAPTDKPLTLMGSKAWRIAIYFSALSAFNIGWRELNVGNWIARIQRYEFTYRATGWVRTVSGIQSLLSVYLLAIWALTYFGRPFE